MILVSWNVNGLRAVYKKNFLEWFQKTKPDILCLQETKSSEDQLPDALKKMDDYHVHFSSAEKKGYSGVALYSRQKPVEIRRHWGDLKFGNEGRILIADYERFLLCNIYFPNGKASPERLAYKMAFYDSFLKWAVQKKEAGRKLVVCGDVNTAHQAMDLSRPRENEKVSGFLPEERKWMDQCIAKGFVDTFRWFYPDKKEQYTWWDQKSRARERNVGWRIDYFFISENLKPELRSAFILSDVMGSDHCPIGMELKD